MSDGRVAAGTSRQRSILRRWAAGALAATSLSIAVAATVPAATASGQGATYVSLGDSYVAGPLIPTQISPLGCLKSSVN